MKDGHRPTRIQQKCQGCLKFFGQLVAVINENNETIQIINKKETENCSLKMVCLQDKCNNVPMETQEMVGNGNGNVDTQDGKDETKVKVRPACI